MRHSFLFYCLSFIIIFQAEAQEISRYVTATGGNEISDLYTYTLGQAVVGNLETAQMHIQQGYQQNYFNPTVSIIEADQLKSINIFPNPTSDLVNINFKATQLISGQLQLRSFLGQIIKRIPIKNEDHFQTRIMLDQLSAGLYLIALIDDTENIIAIQKLLIQK